MTDVPDARLLKQFVQDHSEPAFAELVRRHITLVHSVALRHTVQSQQAEDITQAVFIILARKAASLNSKVVLPGWLYHTARLVAANWQRAETRRIRREQEAYMQHQTEEPAPEAWRELAPLLDDAMSRLGTNDRNAIVLRFFQNQSLADVGNAMGIAERAAQKRVNRALEKLRKNFAGRGVNSTTAVIAGAISSNSIQAVPATFAQSVAAAAMTKGATVSASTLTLIKGALKVMAWTKAQTSIVAVAVVILAIGTTTGVVHKVTTTHREQYYESIFKHPDASSMARLEQCPPVLILRPTHYSFGGQGIGTPDGKTFYDGVEPALLIAWAYGGDPLRLILPEQMPGGSYDYLNTMPNPNDALREAIKKQFGLVAKRKVRPTDVLLLQASDPFKLKSFRTKGAPFACYGTGMGNTQYRFFTNCPLSLLTAQMVEGYFRKPCIDTTEANARYDFTIQWDEPENLTGQSRWNAIQPVLEKQLQQLGLVLVPTNMPVEMLVVEKAN
jgi:uncharacterized protein (TIGR03435 family)